MTARLSAVVSLIFCAALASAVPAYGQSDEEIAAARARGVKYLKQKQKGDGSWEFGGHDLGITALCTIALIENGVPLNDTELQKGYEYVKKNTIKLKNTYDLSLAIVLLSRFGDRRDRPLIKALAARLIAGQMDSGGWHYECPVAGIDPEKILRDPSTGPKPKEGYGDNSCTQFAVLGLWVASRIGVNIDKTLTRVEKRFTKNQADDGGWAYVAETKDGKAPSGESMTGAGLFCLAVAQANQIRDAAKSGKKTEGPEATGKALLEGKVFSRGLKRTGDFVKGIGAHSGRYFLWSIERVGVLLGMEEIGETKWFQKGAEGLLKSQKEDGGWPTAWAETDKDGLSDTCFALLFLRKANLGSDISRLLEGEHAQKFLIVGRKPAARFDTIEEAVEAAQPSEIIRIEGNGPYRIGHLELTKNVTIQAGFGYAPVFKFEIGMNRLGIKLKPETDPNARDMISIAGGHVTLEGLRLQMDPPTAKSPVPWRAVTVKSGSLRILNCTISEANKQGMTSVVVETPGRFIVRNSMLVGGKAGIEMVTNDEQEVVIDNSIIFTNAGLLVTSDAKSKKPADLTVDLSHAVFQVKEVMPTPKITGKIEVTSRLSVFQADWVGSSLLPSANDTKGRSWKGTLNIYDVKQWVGSGGKAVAGATDYKGWRKLWGNSETESFGRPVAFGGLRQLNSYSHDCSPQDWQIEFGVDADSLLVRARVGIDSYIAGPGQTFEQYRETISYSDWQKGRLDLTDLERSPKVNVANR
jgi:hypothetical protein